MTATIGAFILGTAAALVGYHLMTRSDRRRARNNLAATQMERNYWKAKYHDNVSRLITELHGSDNATFHLLAWEREMEAES